jgi:uracil-DNA glycosylase
MKKISPKQIKSIENFVDGLARTNAPINSYNPWSYDLKTNAMRRGNLIAYLKILMKSNPKVMLVGEAPGYRGTRKTGTPFSPEKIMTTNPFFKSDEKFTVENNENPMGEASATIVWRVMDELKFYPLIWAAFPFHPHKPGNPESNRTPTTSEIMLGQKFIKDLIGLFKIKKIVALGRAGEKTLKEMGIETSFIRHPSHGGATLFRRGMTTLAKNLK